MNASTETLEGLLELLGDSIENRGSGTVLKLRKAHDLLVEILRLHTELEMTLIELQESNRDFATALRGLLYFKSKGEET
jgi:hypothetical protein